MKCPACNFEAPVKDFRYLYNARIDSSISMRQCPTCKETLNVDELGETVLQIWKPGESPWGKSSGIEGLAEDVKNV